MIPLNAKQPQQEQLDLEGNPIKVDLQQTKPRRKASSGSAKKKIVVDTLVELRETIERIFKDEDAVLITTQEELLEFLRQQEVFGLDTETTGLRFYRDKIAGFSVGTATRSAYIPLQHKIGQNYQDDIETLCEILHERKYYGFNWKFDQHFLEHFNPALRELPLVGEGSVALRCYDIGLPHKLKDVYKAVIDPSYEEYSFSKLFKGKPFDEFDPKDVYKYAAVDARKHYVVTDYFEKKLQQELPDVYYRYKSIELRVLKPTYNAEEYGIRLDTNQVETLYNALETEKERTLGAVREIVGNSEFNPGSPKQVTEAYASLGYNLKGTSEEIIAKIDHPLSSAILDYRGVVKLQGTYTTNLYEFTDVRNELTIIHSDFVTIGADCVTGDTTLVNEDGVTFVKDHFTDYVEGYEDYSVFITNEHGEQEVTTKRVSYIDVPTIKLDCMFNHSLEGTPNHPVRVIPASAWRGSKYSKIKEKEDAFWEKVCWKPLEKVSVGDFILQSLHKVVNDSPLQESGFVPIEPYIGRKGSTVMPTHINEDFAEFLGMYHADGVAGVKDTHNYFVSLRNIDTVVEERFKTLSASLFDLSPAKTIDRRNSRTGSLTIADRKLCQLEKYITHGKRNKKVPDVIWSARDSVFNAYVRGATLDASVKGKSLYITFILKEDAERVRARLMAQGIYCRVYGEASNKDGTMAYGVAIYPEDMLNFLSIVGVIKTKKLAKLDLIDFSTPMSYYKYARRDCIIAIPVQKKSHSTNTVYDFTVPDSHSFIGNGFLCHNTTRMSSRDPNLQNIPRLPEYRAMFIARPGHKLVSCDFSQQEVRIIAYLAGDEVMIKAFESGKDFYAVMASIVFKLPYEECGKHGKHGDKRNQMKAVVLGLNYSMGIKSLASDLGVAEDEAQRIVNAFYEVCPKVRAFQQYALDFAKSHGYNETIFKHRRYYKGLGYKARGLERFEVFGPGLKNSNITEEEVKQTLYSLGNSYYKLKDFIKELERPAAKKDTKHLAIYVRDRESTAFAEERQATNSIIQGTGAEMTKLAMIVAEEDEELKSLGARMINFIHDEIMLEAPEETAEKAGHRLSEIMNDVCADMLGGLQGGVEPEIMSCWIKS